MLSVTFLDSLLVKAEHLTDLMRMAGGVAATVAHVSDGTAPTAAAPVAAAPNATPKPRAKRRTKAEMAAAAGAPADVAPVEPPVKAAVAVVTPAPDTAVAVVAAAPKKATRRTKAQIAADAAVAALEGAATGGKAGAAVAAAVSVLSDVDTADLLPRFATLIDTDFTLAKSVLDEFGVNRFSDLKPEALGGFAAKLSELGV